MENTNKIWYLVTAIFIVIVIGVISVIAISKSNKIDNMIVTKMKQNDSLYEDEFAMANDVRETHIRSRPDLLPKPPHCGFASGDNKIIGGRVLEFDEQPWTALLEYQYDEGFTTFDCGGTLINREYVITAAHCLFDTHRKLVGVLLGEQDLFNEYDCLTGEPDECAIDKPKLYPISKIIIHPYYSNTTKQNDIALVKLNGTVKYNEITKPICLPSDGFYNHHFSKKAFAVGWGLTNSSDKSSESNVKKIVDLPIWDREMCAQKFRTIDKQICAGGEAGKDSCTYDSGGPLVGLAHHTTPPAWFLEGIVSYGFNGGCGINGYPGVYTNVSAYMDWIVDTITR